MQRDSAQIAAHLPWDSLTTALQAGPETLRARDRQLPEYSRAAATRTAYASDIAQFRAWCAAQAPPLEALPAQPMTVALYLAALAEVRKWGISRGFRIVSISRSHRIIPDHRNQGGSRTFQGR